MPPAEADDTYLWCVDGWLRALSDLGLAAEVWASGEIGFALPIEWRELSDELECVLVRSHEGPFLVAAVPVLGVRPSRIARLVDGLDNVAVVLADEWIEVAVEAPPLSELGAESDVGRSLRGLTDAVIAILDCGGVDVADALDDEQVSSALEGIDVAKAVDPRAAVEVLRETAGRCEQVGDHFLAGSLRVAAGEVLLELGEVAEAAQLIVPAWELLDAPLYDAALATTVAQLRGRQGDPDGAVLLMEQTLAQQDEPEVAAVVRGDLGVLLAQAGRRVEASEMLRAATNDPVLSPERRAHFRSQLEALMGVGGSPAEALSDVLDGSSADLNELASLLLQPDIRMIDRGRIQELIAAVAARDALLGPAQLARLEMARAVLALLGGDPVAAGALFHEASETARAAGDLALAESIARQGQTLLGGMPARPSDSAPLELMAYLVNSALSAVGSDVRRAAREAAEAVDLVDRERHRYSSVADRLEWARLAGRAYELALLTARAVGDTTTFVEVLERVRAQGTPASATEFDGGVSEAEREGTLVERVLGLAREEIGDRPVSPPVIASPGIEASELEIGSVGRVPLDGVITSVAGASAWWWSSHVFGERHYWAVRSPAGELRCEVDMVSGGAERVRAAADAFSSVTTESDLDGHVLLGDAEGRLGPLLSDVASWLIPPPLAAALRDAVMSQEVLVLIWAGSASLGRLPVSLLPLGPSARVVHAAAVVAAPPTSMVIAAGPEHAVGHARPVLLVLGGDGDLGMLEQLTLAIAPTPHSVLGAPRHVRAGLAGATATPERVRAALRANIESVAVYYGHVDHDSARSGSAAMSLTDGVRRAWLSANDLLTGERGGSPYAVVVAGCSSLSAGEVGTGEWWGLATALLWQGSRHVIGSLWDVLPTAATEQLVAELAAGLRQPRSPAAVLHELQRRLCDHWQATGTPSPYEWAGWTLVSFSPGVPSNAPPVAR